MNHEEHEVARRNEFKYFILTLRAFRGGKAIRKDSA